ncbi:hypothetical protein GF376_03270 [Candidatus Peregrinibacteria bacterium]|nr:hypothetical protein [Candidatus Peregrinibacteria bacterium]
MQQYQNIQNNPPQNPQNFYSNQSPENNSNQQYDSAQAGPRRISFFTLVAKTFLGFLGGTAGAFVLLAVFLLASAILQPVLMPGAVESDQINPIFMVVMMGMIFSATLISSLLSPFLIQLTERERYPKISSSIYQIFIINIVIFAFTAPIYLTTNVTNLEITAYAAGLQIVLVSTASSLIMEIVNDQKYPLLGVYSAITAILVATAICLFLFQLMQSTTILLFAVLPIIWMTIGFFQAALPMFYYWYYSNWGIDFLAAGTTYGSDYAETQNYQNQEAEEQQYDEDQDGADFLKS